MTPYTTVAPFFERKRDGKKSFFVLVIGAYCSSKSTHFKMRVIQEKATKKVVRKLIITKAELIGNVSQV